MRSGGSITEKTVSRGNGGFHLVRTQDCEDMLKAIHDLPDHMTRKSGEARMHLGTIPNILAVAWANEWGVRLFSKEWLDLSIKRVTKDPNWKNLKVDKR